MQGCTNGCCCTCKCPAPRLIYVTCNCQQNKCRCARNLPEMDHLGRKGCNCVSKWRDENITERDCKEIWRRSITSICNRHKCCTNTSDSSLSSEQESVQANLSTKKLFSKKYLAGDSSSIDSINYNGTNSKEPREIAERIDSITLYNKHKDGNRNKVTINDIPEIITSNNTPEENFQAMDNRLKTGLANKSNGFNDYQANNMSIQINATIVGRDCTMEGEKFLTKFDMTRGPAFGFENFHIFDVNAKKLNTSVETQVSKACCQCKGKSTQVHKSSSAYCLKRVEENHCVVNDEDCGEMVHQSNSYNNSDKKSFPNVIPVTEKPKQKILPKNKGVPVTRSICENFLSKCKEFGMVLSDARKEEAEETGNLVQNAEKNDLVLFDARKEEAGKTENFVKNTEKNDKIKENREATKICDRKTCERQGYLPKANAQEADNNKDNPKDAKGKFLQTECNKNTCKKQCYLPKENPKDAKVKCSQTKCDRKKCEKKCFLPKENAVDTKKMKSDGKIRDKKQNFKDANVVLYQTNADRYARDEICENDKNKKSKKNISDSIKTSKKTKTSKTKAKNNETIGNIALIEAYNSCDILSKAFPCMKKNINNVVEPLSNSTINNSSDDQNKSKSENAKKIKNEPKNMEIEELKLSITETFKDKKTKGALLLYLSKLVSSQHQKLDENSVHKIKSKVLSKMLKLLADEKEKSIDTRQSGTRFYAKQENRPSEKVILSSNSSLNDILLDLEEDIPIETKQICNNPEIVNKNTDALPAKGKNNKLHVKSSKILRKKPIKSRPNSWNAIMREVMQKLNQTNNNNRDISNPPKPVQVIYVNPTSLDESKSYFVQSEYRVNYAFFGRFDAPANIRINPPASLPPAKQGFISSFNSLCKLNTYNPPMVRDYRGQIDKRNLQQIVQMFETYKFQEVRNERQRQLELRKSLESIKPYFVKRKRFYYLTGFQYQINNTAIVHQNNNNEERNVFSLSSAIAFVLSLYIVLLCFYCMT